MSTKFILDREIAFIHAINKELIQNVIGQEVFYYAISIPQTKANRVYGEAVRKTWNAPVQCNALVRYDNPTVITTNSAPDTKFEAEVYFHKQELDERNVSPKEGDFLEFGQIFYEISSVTQPQLIFGQVNNKMMTKCNCVMAREGQFRPGSQSSTNKDNSHPIQQVKAENK